MSPNSKAARRAITLVPNRKVVAISARGVNKIDPGEASAARIGQKAVGLLTIPVDWTPSFFVVQDEALSADLSDAAVQSLLAEAASCSGVVPNRVIVRSNGVQEDLSQRGALESRSCTWASVLSTLRTLRDEAAGKTGSPTHWIVQNELVVHAKGHLSNERRVRHEKRDWVAEIEGRSGNSADQISLAVRRWREGDQAHEERLSCDSALKISLALKQVAIWAVQDSRRFLFEWVWDGAAVYIVQMDVASQQRGENPRKLLPSAIPQVSTHALRSFVPVTAEQKQTLRKLSNAALYEELGYRMPPFYVLNDPAIMGDLIKGGPLPSSLIDDLNLLTAHRPLILRTEGIGLPPDKKEMLPRTEELRSGEAAAKWLFDSFGPEIRKLEIADKSIALIGHHFIPSVSSAWARGTPGKRWVRIEALWGIPESLYWHAHDTLEVDTEMANLAAPVLENCAYDVRSRQRFKGTFIAPDQDGAWVHHETKPPHDWAPTITSRQLICEIAHTTQRICEREGKPVLVMWFVENHPDATQHRVLPWYHSVIENPDTPVRAPRKKIRTSQEFNIRTEEDWIHLKDAVAAGVRVERITVEPHDPALVRSQTFAQELGSFAHLHGIVVVLSGGILAHAYHALRRAGAEVECVDLFGADEDRVEYNKVVRDKIPDQISNRGESFELVYLSGDALVLALRRKLVEEALETLDAVTGTDLIAELADVQEVVSAIAKAIGVPEKQLEEERLRKLKKRGAFDGGQMLLTTVSPYSIVRPASSDQLITGDAGVQVRTISDPLHLPHKALYKRPDHRNIGDGTEELLVIETELHLLGKLHESINFELPPHLDARKYTSCIELSRTGGELRAAVRLQTRLRKGEAEGQLSLEFEPNPD
jgi:predicted house-cleaning noncanonical NTP pyrophosphatase (MazG superfamily)